MILTCPECSTRYLAKDNAIGTNGRTVRCSKCQTSWFVSGSLDDFTLKDNETDILSIAPVAADTGFRAEPPAQSSDLSARAAPGPDSVNSSPKEVDIADASPALASPPRGAHIDIRDRADRQRRNRRLTVVALIWGLTLGLLGIAAGLAYSFRQDIVNHTPKMATLYKAFGIEVSRDGLNFDPPVTRSVFIDGEPVLVINGTVKNISGRRIDLPLIAFSLHNNGGDKLAEWRVEFEQADLEKDERADYVAHFPSPPIDAVNLRYRFADEPVTNDTLSVATP